MLTMAKTMIILKVSKGHTQGDKMKNGITKCEKCGTNHDDYLLYDGRCYDCAPTWFCNICGEDTLKQDLNGAACKECANIEDLDEIFETVENRLAKEQIMMTENTSNNYLALIAF